MTANKPKDIIILNGPPGSGKDAICNYLVDYWPDCKHLEVKKRLFELVLSISGMEPGEWWALYDNRITKEKPHPKLANLSPRQFMIHVSESVMKPLFGKDYFGRYAAEQVAKHHHGMVVFSDGGFPEEVQLLSAAGSVHLVHIYREGYSFEGDSRNYLDPNLPYLSTFLRVDQKEGDIDYAIGCINDHLDEWWQK